MKIYSKYSKGSLSIYYELCNREDRLIWKRISPYDIKGGLPTPFSGFLFDECPDEIKYSKIRHYIANKSKFLLCMYITLKIILIISSIIGAIAGLICVIAFIYMNTSIPIRLTIFGIISFFIISGIFYMMAYEDKLNE